VSDGPLTRAEVEAKQLENWLCEHLPYELSMLRYSFRKMAAATDQCDYNAHYECFAIKPRLLLDFIGCRDKNVKATNFVERFKPPDRQHLIVAFKQLDTQVHHNVRSRPSDASEKIRYDDCERIALWVEAGMDAFLQMLTHKERTETWGSKVDPHEKWKIVPSLCIRAGSPAASSGGMVMTTATSGAIPVSLKNVSEQDRPPSHVVITSKRNPDRNDG
jgi:hypothetical protein